MAQPDLPPQEQLKAQPDLPPQSRTLFLYAAGGGFLGALLAIVVAKILAGPCCCPGDAAERNAGASASSLPELSYESEHAFPV